MSFINYFSMMFTILVLGIASIVLFNFIPKSRNSNQTRSIKQFILFFFTSAVAFVAFLFTDQHLPQSQFLSFHKANLFGLNADLKDSIGLFCYTFFYVTAVLYIRHGLKIRKKPHTPDLLKTKAYYIHVAIACCLQLIFYNALPTLHPVRISILNLHLIFIFLSMLPYVAEKNYAEKITTFIIYMMSLSIVFATLPLFFKNTYAYYNVFVMNAQALQYTIWTGTLFLLLLADSIAIYYKNSITDDLTGIYNRRYFIDTLNNTLTQNTYKKASKMAQTIHPSPSNNAKNDSTYEHETQNMTAIIVSDIDNFKGINDAYGHEVGDIVISTFAKILQNNIRESDTLARIGGEEFAILLTNITPTEVKSIAERMRVHTQNHVLSGIKNTNHDFEKNSICFTASFGIATFSENISSSAYLNAADNALYKAKKTGKNKVCIYENDIDTAITSTGLQQLKL